MHLLPLLLFPSSFALARYLPRASNLVQATPTDIASGETQKQLAAQAFQNAWNALPDVGTCSKQTVHIRREFRSLSLPQRKAYTDALQCLQQTPSVLNNTQFPGAKTRYDDFVLVHINMTGFIHASAQFLTWHRFFTWTFDQALNKDCNYTGPIPFWEWGVDAALNTTLRDSELFNGDPYSMGSDGVFLPNNTAKTFNLSSILGTEQGAITTFPAGSGGGPVFSGPFSGNYTINLGPILLPYGTPVASPFDYNPRALTRSLRLETAQTHNTYSNYTPIVLNSTTPFEFQTRMDNDHRNIALPPVSTLWGPHGAGHNIPGGDPGDDLAVSPGEPMFWLHHGQIDRLYWMWQNLDPTQYVYRTSNIPNLTMTMYNTPPSAYGTLTDLLDINFLAPPMTINQSLSTVSGAPFCYIYQ